MKMAFIVHTEYHTAQVMQVLKDTGIDYYSRWDRVVGKGAGSDPHLGEGAYGSTNSVLMIAFDDEEPLHRLIERIRALNAGAKRSDDRVRLFQVPLERIV